MQQTNKCTEKYQKPKSTRWLNDEELQRLWFALEESQNQKAANVIRLLLLTGSRRSEVLQATLDQFDLERGSWTKKNALLPLSSQAIKLLQNMKNESNSNFVFPGKVPTKSLSGIQKVWAALCERAQLPGFRISGLRETYASHLLESGLSFSVIDKLLGYSRRSSIIHFVPLTFERLKQATEVFSNKIEEIASKPLPIKNSHTNVSFSSSEVSGTTMTSCFMGFFLAFFTIGVASIS
jgi:site-specific recombinase XerD